MTTRLHILLMTAGAVSALWADAVELSPSARAILHQSQCLSRTQDPPPYQPMMLQVADEATVDSLKAKDVIIFNRRSDLLLSSIPREKVEEVLALPGVVNADVSGDMSTLMDKARPMGRVDAAQQGAPPLTQAYDGTGVIVGFSDTGFDSRHIAFKDKVGAIYDYNAAEGLRLTAESPEEIAEWTTDNSDEFHATHVANILGGHYMGCGYYGVATGSEMVAATSRLTDVGILAGVEDIIAYANKKGMPAVVNLSLGNFLGAHDGSSLFCQYLSRCADDAVICLSAGNTGGVSGYASCTLDTDTDIRRVTVNSKLTWDGFDVYGQTEIWGDDATPFRFRFEVYDMDTREIVYASPWTSGTQADQLSVSSDTDPEWANYFNGELYAACGISPLNGRRCVSAIYDTHTLPPASNSSGRWSRYYTSLAVWSDKGADVQFFADATYSYIGPASRDTSPTFSHDGSISDMCTAEGVIAVGACNSRNKAPLLDGTMQEWDFSTNTAGDFSSYSTAPRIPRLPHFAAPGRQVVSAMSTPYLETHEDMWPFLAAYSKVDANDYYWIAQAGTSMASPFSAGVIALWLQADPTLTAKEIIDIAQKTARTDFSDIEDPRWGAGCIDAQAGLEYILARDALPSITTIPAFTVSADRRVEPQRPGVKVYAINGTEAGTGVQLEPGIYIVRSPEGEASKITIR